jgi:hypothetical protein
MSGGNCVNSVSIKVLIVKISVQKISPLKRVKFLNLSKVKYFWEFMTPRHSVQCHWAERQMVSVYLKFCCHSLHNLSFYSAEFLSTKCYSTVWHFANILLSAEYHSVACLCRVSLWWLVIWQKLSMQECRGVFFSVPFFSKKKFKKLIFSLISAKKAPHTVVVFETGSTFFSLKILS